MISLDKPPLNELTHYGVLGMKWGVRKDRLSSSVKKISEERKKIKETKGVSSKAFIDNSKELYIKKQQLRLLEAKKAGNKAEEIRAKQELRWAKAINKPGGSHGYFWSALEPVYGRLSADEKTLLIEAERKRSVGQARVKKILSVAGTVVIPLASAVAIAEGKKYVSTGKFGIPSLGFENGQPIVRVR